MQTQPRPSGAGNRFDRAPKSNAGCYRSPTSVPESSIFSSPSRLRSAMVRPLDAVIEDAALLQFIVVNPMKGVIATNQEGNPSARCQNNVRARRHVVAEFDDPALTKRMQAQVASALGQSAPLVLAVDSGGKSVHAWYRVDGMTDREQGRFFAAACALGADATRWDVCGWLRMPGGLRVVNEVPQKRQRILYFKGQSNG